MYTLIDKVFIIFFFCSKYKYIINEFNELFPNYCVFWILNCEVYAMIELWVNRRYVVCMFRKFLSFFPFSLFPLRALQIDFYELFYFFVILTFQINCSMYLKLRDHEITTVST